MASSKAAEEASPKHDRSIDTELHFICDAIDHLACDALYHSYYRASLVVGGTVVGGTAHQSENRVLSMQSTASKVYAVSGNVSMVRTTRRVGPASGVGYGRSFSWCVRILNIVGKVNGKHTEHSTTSTSISVVHTVSIVSVSGWVVGWGLEARIVSCA